MWLLVGGDALDGYAYNLGIHQKPIVYEDEEVITILANSFVGAICKVNTFRQLHLCTGKLETDFISIGDV